MNFVFQVLKEQILNFHLIVRLATYDIKGKYQMHYLGAFWQFLNPILRILTYWIVFGLGMRSGQPIGDTPYIIWMLVGLIPWFFISPSIMQGSNSIYQRVNLVSKMKFPVSILPTISIVGNAFSFIIMLIILILLLYTNKTQSYHLLVANTILSLVFVYIFIFIHNFLFNHFCYYKGFPDYATICYENALISYLLFYGILIIYQSS